MVQEQDESANANPTRRFFLEVVTKDIALEDAVLDLIDNSVDGLIRTKGNDVEKIALSFGTKRKTLKGSIKVDFSAQSFSITDDCGGIPFVDARDHAFRFGREKEATDSSLSVYGIGMKRALFKIGSTISVKSQTQKDGWTVSIQAKDWVKDENPDWSFPIGRISPVKKKSLAGTKIEIKDLSAEVQSRIRSKTFSARIKAQIATAYALFMERGLTIIVNGDQIEPKSIPLGESKDIKPAIKNYESNGVAVTVVASVMQTIGGKMGSGENAGWYILCNGRVVHHADKSADTGWGVRGLLPSYHAKHRQFVGIAFFFSTEPEKLPWTTTKRGLNPDSLIYQNALEVMTTVARPILNLINKKYPSAPEEEEYERPLSKNTSKRVDVREARIRDNQSFMSDPTLKKDEGDEIKIQFRAKRDDVTKIKRRLKKPNMSGTKIGEYVFNYFLKNEVD